MRESAWIEKNVRSTCTPFRSIRRKDDSYLSDVVDFLFRVTEYVRVRSVVRIRKYITHFLTESGKIALRHYTLFLVVDDCCDRNSDVF